MLRELRALGAAKEEARGVLSQNRWAHGFVISGFFSF